MSAQDCSAEKTAFDLTARRMQRDGDRAMASMLRRRLTTLALGAVLSGSAFAQPAKEPNVIPLVVRTPHGGFNRMVVSVTVCEPGTDRCATIDDVMVDTGSTGLRLEASAVPTWLHLPPVVGPDRMAIAECLRFVHDTAWGPLVRADVRLGGLTTSQLSLQIIDDGGGPQPAACPRSNVRPTSSGTLGIGQPLFDCPGACQQDPDFPGTFVGTERGWTPLVGTVDDRYRLPNPVARLPVHSNGIVIDLPSPPGGGSKEITGTLTFGVGTTSNNQLGVSNLVRLDVNGRFTTVFNGKTFPASIIDSGTETYVFDDDRLPRCRGMNWAYCVVPRRSFAAEMLGQDGTRADVRMTIGDYKGRRDQHAGALDGLAESAPPHSAAFVWGAPFFLGRRTFLVFDGQAVPGTPGATGPFFSVR